MKEVWFEKARRAPSFQRDNFIVDIHKSLLQLQSMLIAIANRQENSLWRFCVQKS